mmetsp:Transcript_8032/g.16592  ORF Transcript_8032/g.16592 Transcript_8032/m.16592 type:complete len:696 (+) Transcript_8032:241-2328(+)
MVNCGAQVVASFFFSALLPPFDDSEPSFYDVLGLESTCDGDDLRKAYRKLSLKLHPDKITQRGGGKEEQQAAAEEYEKIQEAYNVLNDEKKRLKYDALGTPKRYRFVENSRFADPQSVYENLIGSSLADRTRLVGLFFVAILLVLMQPILVAAKINQSLRGEGSLEDSSWVAILVPYWIFGGLLIALTLVATFLAPKKDRLAICLSGAEQFCWYLGVVLLCVRWDGDGDGDGSYRQTLWPIYIAVTLRWSRSLLTLYTVRKDVNRMVTMDFIERELLKGRSMDELPEEEQNEIEEAFLIVSTDPEFEPSSEDLMDDDLEEEKVESSPEFASAMEIYNATFYALAWSIAVKGIFLILLTLKLDENLSDGTNWWAVFTPVWIERGWRLLFNLYKCCGLGEEIAVYLGSDFPAASGEAVDTAEIDPSTDPESKPATTGNDGAAEVVSSEARNDDESDKNATANNNKTSQPGAEPGGNTANGNTRDALAPASTGNTPEVKEDPPGLAPGDKYSEDGDDEEIHMDEETHDAFQQAYSEAEAAAREERSQSCFESVGIIASIIMLCLVVAKLDKAYGSSDPDDVGFNVFWILFPFFLFFGLTCCCCACLIFGAAPETEEDDESESKAGEPSEEDDPENPSGIPDGQQGGGDVTIIPVQTTDKEEGIAVEAAIITPDTEADEPKPMSYKSDPPAESAMDDLD